MERDSMHVGHVDNAPEWQMLETSQHHVWFQSVIRSLNQNVIGRENQYLLNDPSSLLMEAAQKSFP